MRKLRIILLLTVLCATTMLSACDSTAQSSAPAPAEAIKLAKQAASHLASPPSRNDWGFMGGTVPPPTPFRSISTPDLSQRINEAKLWPDEPASVTVTQDPNISCVWLENALPASEVMTLTTAVTSDQAAGSTDVTFISNWRAKDKSAEHSWQFHVDKALIAQFTGEQGNELPVCVINGGNGTS